MQALLILEDIMDRLRESAKAFQKLLNKEYHVKIGFKGKKTVDFVLQFDPADFKHLTGIQHLYDLKIYKKTSEDVFYDSLNGNLKETDLHYSIHFDGIQERLENLKNLEKYLDSNMIFFKWENKYKDIRADYMLKEDIPQENRAYIFVKEKQSLFSSSKSPKKIQIDEIKKENTISFFLTKSREYDNHATKFTLLKNVKVDKTNNTKTILFDFEEVKKTRAATKTKEKVIENPAKEEKKTPLNERLPAAIVEAQRRNDGRADNGDIKHKDNER